MIKICTHEWAKAPFSIARLWDHFSITMSVICTLRKVRCRCLPFFLEEQQNPAVDLARVSEIRTVHSSRRSSSYQSKLSTRLEPSFYIFHSPIFIQEISTLAAGLHRFWGTVGLTILSGTGTWLFIFLIQNETFIKESRKTNSKS